MRLHLLFLSTLFAYSTSSFAMFCPTNMNSIDIGDSIKQVEAQCGKPSSEKKSKPSDDNQPQEWTYLMRTDPNSPGTMKVTFAFVNNKIANITSNGVGVGATAICNNINLSIGSGIKEVERACGKPSLVTKSEQPKPADQVETEITTWKYDGSPSVTLIFENGILKERK